MNGQSLFVLIVLVFVMAFIEYREGANRKERTYLLDRIQSGDPNVAKVLNKEQPQKTNLPPIQFRDVGTATGLEVEEINKV